jgi:hypothetical protein
VSFVRFVVRNCLVEHNYPLCALTASAANHTEA